MSRGDHDINQPSAALGGCRMRANTSVEWATFAVIFWFPFVFWAALPSLGHAGDLPGAILAFEEGEVALASGDLNNALRLYDQAIELEPELAYAHHRRGVVLVRLGLNDDGIEALEQAVALAPDEASVHLDLALAYLGEDDLFWAADEITLAAELSPDNAEVAFYEGFILLQLDEARAAIDAFERAQDDPGYGPGANYYLGVASNQTGDLDQASVYFERAADLGAETRHGQAALEAVTMLIRRDWDIPPLVSGSLTLGGQYDSNVVLEPDDAVAPLGADAPGLAFRGFLMLAPISTPSHTLFGTASAGRTNHFADPPSQFNLTTGSLGLGYQGRFVAARLTNTVQLTYRYDLGLLDGGDLTDDPELYAYREANSVTAQYSIGDGEHHITFLELRYRNAVFTDTRRDSNMVAGRLGETLMFLSQRLKVLLSLEGRYEDAFGDGYDLWAVEGTVGLSALDPLSLRWLWLVGLEHADHISSAYYYGWGPGREDDAWTMTLSVGRSLWDDLFLNLAWMHTNQASTTAAFDYQRNLVSLTLSWVFP